MKALESTILMCAALAWVACGVGSPQYREYTGDDGTSQTEVAAGEGVGTGDTSCAGQVAAAFGLVENAIDSTCGNSGCHGDGTGGGLTLSPGENSANEAALWSFTGGDPAKLIGKLSDGGSHTGGVQIPSTLASSAITTWHNLKNSDCGE